MVSLWTECSGRLLGGLLGGQRVLRTLLRVTGGWTSPCGLEKRIAIQTKGSRVSMMVSNWQHVCECLQETELDINNLQTHTQWVAFQKSQGSSLWQKPEAAGLDWKMERLDRTDALGETGWPWELCAPEPGWGRIQKKSKANPVEWEVLWSNLSINSPPPVPSFTSGKGSEKAEKSFKEGHLLKDAKARI